MSFTETWKKYTGSVVVATRYVGTFGAGIVVAAGVAGMSVDDAHKLLDGLQQIGTGLSTAMTGIGTVATILMGAYATFKSTRPQQAATVAKMDGLQVVATTAPGQAILDSMPAAAKAANT